MVFINDMMNSAIYFDYELNKDNLVAGIRYNVVGQFIEGYQYYRPLSDLEKSAIIDVYNLLSPFLCMKIDKLIETAENSRFEDVNTYIEGILLQFQNSSTAINNIK